MEAIIEAIKVTDSKLSKIGNDKSYQRLLDQREYLVEGLIIIGKNDILDEQEGE